MTPSMFGDAPILPSWVRLVLGFVAVLHALLCARVVIMRIVRVREPAHPERVPTAAMIAYGTVTAYMADRLLRRIPDGLPLVWESIGAFTITLAAGSVAFAQIVYLTRRRDKRPRTRPH